MLSKGRVTGTIIADAPDVQAALNRQHLTSLKRAGKKWCPPALLSLGQSALSLLGLSSQGQLRGPYADWRAAEQASTTYANPVILEAVAAATAKLLSGTAAYERDSVIFSEAEWPWPLLSALAAQAACDSGQLRVLDFGGSLGATFLVARRFLDARIQLRWHVVEQPHYVARAAELPFPEDLQFFDTLEKACRSLAPNVVIASGVLHYLPRPWDVLRQLSSLDAETLVIDRTPCVEGDEDLITVQRVPAAIFPASYPSWVFGKHRIEAALEGRYRVLARLGNSEELIFRNRTIKSAGWVFKRA